MDLLSQHEAFLRAIFDAPEDDTPRLVYADFLQENGEEERAEFIRWQCGQGEKPANVPDFAEQYERGFARPARVSLDGDLLHDAHALRQRIVTECPQWFGAASLGVHAELPLDPARVETLLGLPAFTCITHLDLGGMRETGDDAESGELVELYIEPSITGSGVVALAANRAMRRVTELILTNNELDNDAARALVNSPYLGNLKRLQLLEGNRFRGKVWQQVIERFGEDVVG